MPSPYVLVVDDDVAIRRLVCSTLTDAGYHVREAADGIEALALITQEPPELIFLDMRMPNMDGWTLAAELTRRRIDVPLIVMTADGRAHLAALKLGARDYLGKPFAEDDVLRVLMPPPSNSYAVGLTTAAQLVAGPVGRTISSGLATPEGGPKEVVMAVVGIEVSRREPYADGREFGEHGAYEHIEGLAHFAVDPGHEANRAIVDLDLAPRDAQGLVRFTADISLVLRQRDDGPRRLLVELPNRGRRRVYQLFNRASADAGLRAHPGDGFLFHHGFSVCSIGWQWDVYRSDTLMALEAPEVQVDGQPVRGQAVVELRPNERRSTFLLANRQHQPYPVADLDDPDARLVVRDWEDGPDTEISREQWQFAQETERGIEASREHVYLAGGFDPGRIYYVTYTAVGARLVGAGLLALRDIAAFLREPSEGNPSPAGFDRSYAFGVSQTGRMLRHFLHLGLNVAEDGRQVFDGILPHVAGGRRGEFNHRFAQPSAQSVPGFGHLAPFTDAPTPDPFTGKREGLLDRQRAAGGAPKVVYTNTSAEYWRGDGALGHLDAADMRDVAAPPDVRIYHFAGTQHGPGSLPQSRLAAAEGASGRFGFNVVDYAPLLRAALVNLDRWAGEGVEPPPSRHATLADGTAAPRERVLDAFDALPSVVTPDRDRLWVLREVDLGPDATKGIGRYPAVEGREYPCLVAAVDGDGNEIAGIPLPDIAVPVATHAGWNLRHPDTGAPEQQMAMQGFTRFFARTRADREATGDPRPSLEERYASRDAYLDRVREAAEHLVEEGYLLKEDIALVVANCAERYDAALRAVDGEFTEEVAAPATRV
ncbi:MAG: response regulator [Dehalococcoidia bacterium]|nr:response regulator [Dehalococcoidia bacterium]